jgi:hypothetical protein
MMARVAKASGVGLCLFAAATSALSQSAQEPFLPSQNFRVSKIDAQKYEARISDYGKALQIFFSDPTIINPGALNASPGQVRGFPEMAIIQTGQLPIRQSVTHGSPAVCKDLDAVRKYHFSDTGYPTFFSSLTPARGGESEYRFYVARNDTWLARCFSAGTCSVYFSNRKWSAQLIIATHDLCAAPAMNERLKAIVNHWTR